MKFKYTALIALAVIAAAASAANVRAESARSVPARPVSVLTIVDSVLDCGTTRLVLSAGSAGNHLAAPMGGGTFAVSDAEGNGASANCATGCESVVGTGTCHTMAVAAAELARLDVRGVREFVRFNPRPELPSVMAPGDMSANLAGTIYTVNPGTGTGAECHLDRDGNNAVIGATCTDKGGEGGATRTVVTLTTESGCEMAIAPASCTCTTNC